MTTLSQIQVFTEREEQTRIKILALLVAQLRAAGSDKPDKILSNMYNKIEDLCRGDDEGEEAEILKTLSIAVRKNRVSAIAELVYCVLDIIPFLDDIGKPNTVHDNSCVVPVACAIADAYRLACNPSVLGTDLNTLQLISVQRVMAQQIPALKQAVEGELNKVLSSMAIGVRAYIELLNAIPKLATQRTEYGVIWLEDHKNPGVPLRWILEDVKVISRLLAYLPDAERTMMAMAVSTASSSIHRRIKMAHVEPTRRLFAQMNRGI